MIATLVIGILFIQFGRQINFFCTHSRQRVQQLSVLKIILSPVEKNKISPLTEQDELSFDGNQIFFSVNMVCYGSGNFVCRNRKVQGMTRILSRF